MANIVIEIIPELQFEFNFFFFIKFISWFVVLVSEVSSAVFHKRETMIRFQNFHDFQMIDGLKVILH